MECMLIQCKSQYFLVKNVVERGGGGEVSQFYLIYTDIFLVYSLYGSFYGCIILMGLKMYAVTSLPYQSHQWLLGTLIGQCHINSQLIIQDVK